MNIVRGEEINSARSTWTGANRGMEKNVTTIMTKPDSKRVYDRYDCTFSISCARLNSVRYTQGRMLNYSQDGMYFESRSALPPGMSILIRVQKDLTGDRACGIREEFKSLALGEVKWCEEIIKEDSVYYGVGVKYYPPHY